MTCPNCNQKAYTIKSAIVGDAIRTGCEHCLHTLVQGNEMSAQHRRRQQQRHHAADLVQPFEPDFAKLYGEQKAREYGWDDERLRKHG